MRRSGNKFRTCASVLASLTLLPVWALPDQLPVHHMEGTVHGFLVLRSVEGKTLAAGDLTQVVKGDQIVARLTFRFRDGSVDDETTTYSQRGSFRLLSDKHVQKGPSFPHPIDVSIDVPAGVVTVHSTDGGKEKVETNHFELPPDLANGLLLTLLKNVEPDAVETKLSYVAATPKPRLVKLVIRPEAQEKFSTAGAARKATHYSIKVEIGGLAGVAAPLVGKQPKDIQIWILGGEAPAFVRMEGQLYEGGPVWTVELTSPVWPKVD
jgi:hypothetical protein